MGKNTMKVAVLECERLQDRFAPAESYTQLLQIAFDHVRSNAATLLHPQITVPPSVNFVAFDVRAGKYPEDITKFDGVLITGSLSGVYQEDAWIERLLNEIRELDKRSVRTVGIGFGHQAIAQALGGEVARNPKGSEVSWRNVQVTKEGEHFFLPIKTEFRLHYHHNDVIVKMPPNFLVLASNNVTEFQSIYKRRQFLMFCGHPEYSHNMKVHVGSEHPEYSVLAKLLEYDREKLLVPEQLVELALVKEQLSQPTDYEWVIKQILLFYLGDSDKFLDKFP